MRKGLVFLAALVFIALAIGGAALALSWGPVINVSQATVDQYLGDVNSNYVVWEDDGLGNIFVYDFANPITGGTNISNNPTGQSSAVPKISGSVVVWETFDGVTDYGSIYLYDLATPAVPPVCIMAADSVNGVEYFDPSISGDYVVFNSHYFISGNCVEDVYLYNVKTPATPPSAITDNSGDSSINFASPVISGRHIVWQYEFNNGNDADIYFYDIDAPVFGGAALTDGEGSRYVSRPAVDGDIIAWESEDLTTYDDNIFVYDLAHPVFGGTRITNVGNDVYAYHPQVSGGNVVMVIEDEGTNGVDNIYRYDTSAASPSLENISKSTNPTLSPDIPQIDGDYVVWRTADENVWEDRITLCQLSTGTVANVTTDATDDWDPLIGGNRLAWESWRNLEDNNYDIMTTTISQGPTFMALPDSGLPINITEGQVVWANPYIIKVKPYDDTGIDYVECWIDGVRVGNFTGPDADGVYSFAWDTSKYHSSVRVVAYNRVGDAAAITRNATVELPFTGK